MPKAVSTSMMIGIWVSMLRIPFRLLYPAIIIFVCLGVYSVRGSTFDIVMVAAIGTIGYALTQAAFSPRTLSSSACSPPRSSVRSAMPTAYRIHAAFAIRALVRSS